MSKYYVTKNGVLQRYGECPEAWLSQQAAPDESVHAGDPPQELLDALTPPVVPETLQQHKDAKWVELVRARSVEEYSTFTHGGNTYDCDRASTERIMGAVQLALLARLDNQSFSIDWTLADYSVVTLNGPQMTAVGQALAVHVQTVHAKSRGKRQALDNALSFIEVDAITWD